MRTVKHHHSEYMEFRRNVTNVSYKLKQKPVCAVALLLPIHIYDNNYYLKVGTHRVASIWLISDGLTNEG